MILWPKYDNVLPKVKHSFSQQSTEAIKENTHPRMFHEIKWYQNNSGTLHFIGNPCIRLWSYDMMLHIFYRFCLQFMCGNIGANEWKSVATLIQSVVNFVLVASNDKPAFDSIYGLMANFYLNQGYLINSHIYEQNGLDMSNGSRWRKVDGKVAKLTRHQTNIIDIRWHYMQCNHASVLINLRVIFNCCVINHAAPLLVIPQ